MDFFSVGSIGALFLLLGTAITAFVQARKNKADIKLAKRSADREDDVSISDQYRDLLDAIKEHQILNMRQDLTDLRTDLSATRVSLTETKNELAQTRTELNELKQMYIITRDYARRLYRWALSSEREDVPMPPEEVADHLHWGNT